MELELEAVATKTAAWLERLAINSRRQAEQNKGRFDSLAEACEADSKNYEAVAKELRSALRGVEGK